MSHWIPSLEISLKELMMVCVVWEVLPKFIVPLTTNQRLIDTNEDNVPKVPGYFRGDGSSGPF